MKRPALRRGQDRRLAGPPRLPFLDHRPARARGARALRRPAGPARRAVLCFVAHARSSPPGAGRSCCRRSAAPRPLRSLTASYLVATFFNNFLPSNIGGDIVRVRDSSQLTGSTDHLAGRRRHRPHPRLRRALRPRRGGLRRSPPPARARPRRRARGAARPRRSLFGVARLRLLPARAPRAGSWPSRGSTRSTGPREQFEVVQGAVHVYRTRMGTIWVAGAREPRCSRPSSSCYYLAVARALGIPLPAGAAFLMVPLCTLLQAVPVSFNGWGLREGALHPLLRAGRPPAGERPRLLARGRGPHGAAVALRRASCGLARGSAPARAHGRLSGMSVPVLHVCDKFGVRGLQHPRRLAPLLLVVPALRPRALRGLAVRAQAPGARHALARRAGHPGPPPRPRALRPAHPDATSSRLARRARRAHPARPRLRRRRLRPPRRARWPGRSSSSTSTSPTRACPPTRPSPTASSRRWTDARDRREPLDARVPGAASASSPRSACASSGTARRSTSSPPCPRERAAARPARARASPTTPSSSARSAASTRRRATASCSRRPARVLAARAPGPRPDRRRRRPDGRAARSRPRRSGIADRVVFAGHRTDVPDLLGAIDVFCISSLYEGTPLALFEAMAAGQGDRLDRGRRLPRGAGGRRHGPARAARPTPPALADAPRPRPRRRRAARRASAGRRSPPRAATTCAPASTRCRRFYDELLAGGRALRPCPCAGSAAARARRGRCPATCCWAAIPPFVTGGALPRGRRPRLRLPRRRARVASRASSRHLADNGYVTLSADEYVAVLRGQRRAAASAPSC